MVVPSGAGGAVIEPVMVLVAVIAFVLWVAAGLLVATAHLRRLHQSESSDYEKFMDGQGSI